jgi:formylglycine-generating enzyme required for sulfatase activity
MNGYVVPCHDCADLTPPGSGSPTTGRVVRGGDFESELYMLVTSSRLYDDPSVRTSTIGVRCARTP